MTTYIYTNPIPITADTQLTFMEVAVDGTPGPVQTEEYIIGSRRQRVVDAITAQLWTITTANGYSLNVGDHVWPWRDLLEDPLSVTDCPGITFEDGDADMETADLDGDTFNHMPVTFVLHVAGGTTAQTVRNGLNDIATAIENGFQEDSIPIVYYVPDKHSIDVKQDGEVIGAGTYEIKITYQAPRGQI